MTTEIHLDADPHLYIMADIDNCVTVNGQWPADGLTLTARSSLPTKYVTDKKDGRYAPRVPIHGIKKKGVFCSQKACRSPGIAAGEAQIVAFDVPLERSNLCLLLQQCVLTSSVSLHSSSKKLTKVEPERYNSKVCQFFHSSTTIGRLLKKKMCSTCALLKLRDRKLIRTTLNDHISVHEAKRNV
jgi:hypothetical protein